MNTFKNFIKENLVLVIGMTLPVLLIVVFFAASVLPKMMGTPPQYDMLFSTSRYDHQTAQPFNIEFVVKDGVLKARVIKNDKAQQNYNRRQLMVYNGRTDSIKEIDFDTKNMVDAENRAEIVVEETKFMNIDTSNKAPDGYEFDGPTYRSGGLVTELFSGGYRNQGYRVKKGGAGYKLPNTGRDYYYDIQFIGWVVPKNK